MGWKVFLPWLDQVGQYRFPDPGRQQRSVRNNGKAEFFSKAGMTSSVIIPFISWGTPGMLTNTFPFFQTTCPVRCPLIEYYVAVIRHLCLFQVSLAGRPFQYGFENMLNIIQRTLVYGHFSVKIPAKQWFGDVIGRRSRPPVIRMIEA